MVNFATYDYTLPVNPTAVILENCDIYTLGNLDRPVAVYCEEIPNQIVVNNCRGLVPSGSYPDAGKAVMVDPSIDLDTYFDDASSRPNALRFLIDPSTVELSNRQRDLPEQMRPYQANAIEADACPTTGWWKAGTFVKNRNCTDEEIPFGWFCTIPGKPGTWEETFIAFQPAFFVADLNEDGEVNITDLGLLAGAWLNTGTDMDEDFNIDLKIDLEDFAIFADYYLK